MRSPIAEDLRFVARDSGKHVLNLHRYGGTDACERIDHQPNQLAVPLPDRRADIDAVQQLAGFRRFQSTPSSRAA
jgi:hypothetical protein